MPDEATETEATQEHGCLYWGVVALGMAGALALCYHAFDNHAFYKSQTKQETQFPGTTDKSSGIETILKTK